MDFRILGPLEVLENGRALDLGGAKQRAALAVLAVHANQVVSHERLIEALWDDEPPETARKALQVYVSQLRKLLGRDRVETSPHGYLLRLDPEELDVLRFERLHETGDSRAALALWRGDPLADFADRAFARDEIARLQELRLSFLELQLERGLAEGRHAELVGELDALVRRHPLREHLRSQLMLALYRAGRQAEALDVYQAGRRALVEELGIEPGQRLRDLHQQILTQDAGLDPPVRVPVPVPAAPVAPKPRRAAPALGPSTRKTVTVLFCDLAASTELSERFDPESLRNLMQRWYDAMREPIERHGGTVEKFIGDAVMAVFGVPKVHEDDALRAVRAAVEMRTALERLNAELATERRLELKIRVGINTGEVVTGDGITSLVTGDPVNTAKRLEEAAAPGEILIGAATRRLVANATELAPADAVAAKGKRRPVEAWHVLGTIADAAPFARRLDAPLIGRREELAALVRELDTAEREAACRLVTVCGPAGIGKSRLAAEFSAAARGHATVLSARCLAYGDGITFLPLAELVRSAGGDEAIARAVQGEADGAQILDRVRGTLDAGAAPTSTEETFWAIRRLLEILAHERPLVVCLEDVHWAEPTFLDLLEYVAGWSREAPILLLCLARPELRETRPHWGGASLVLEPLTEPESALLLDELGAEWPLAPAERARVADAAEGNPLFLEQMVAMLAEGKTADLPPTIQALLAARLDRLDAEERAVLERAAVVGKEFRRSAVTELTPEEERSGVSSILMSLVRKELVRPEPSAVDDDGFRFRHALIRDAAYAAVPKAGRADLHEAFVPWLERHDAEDELVGYHLEQAYWYRVDLGRRDIAIAARAGELLGASGTRAAARGDSAAALTLLRRALALLPPQHGVRIELLRELSAALWIDGDVDAAELTLSESIDAARAAGDTRFEWYGRLERAARNAATRGDTEALVTTAERAVEVFGALEDDLGLARAWRRIGLVAHTARRFADAAAAFERALEHAEASGDEQERARSADALCSALLFGPAPVAEAIERAERILATASGNRVLRAHVSTSLAGLLAMRGDIDLARTRYGDAGAVYEELGLRLPQVGWTEVVAAVEMLAGDRTAATQALQRGYAVLEGGGFDSLRAHFAATLALALASEGNATGARAYVRACEAWDGVLDHDTAARLRAAESLLVSEPLDAERLAREAVAAALRTDDLNLQAAMRLVLARVVGDAAEADEAKRLFDAKGNVAAAATTGLWSLQT